MSMSMKETTRRMGQILYLLGVAALIISIAYYLLAFSPHWSKFLLKNIHIFILLGFLIKFTPVGKPVLFVANKVYYLTVYQNKIFWELFYDILFLVYPIPEWKNMNYGYAPSSKTGHSIKLDPEDELERFSLQLYHLAVTAGHTLPNASIEKMTIAEVSSGRAGGLLYIQKYLKPQKLIGIDISQVQVDHCNKVFGKDGKMVFYQGGAEKLTKIKGLTNEHIDMIFTVDSAHLYSDFNAYVNESAKILKKGGLFIVADFRETKHWGNVDKFLKEHPEFTVEKAENYTSCVLNASNHDQERRLDMIQNKIGFLFRPFLKYNSGAKGSRIIKGFESGNFQSYIHVLRKL
jgi:SAM-dependent methyltransferase